jgi:hypothetical protein
MNQPRTVRCHQTVERRFDEVATVLRRQPSDLFQRATTSAAVRAAALAAHLRVEIVGLEVGVDVRLFVRRVREVQSDIGLPSALSVELTWEAIRNPELFPSMLAELTARPLSAYETQLELSGTYWTPMGLLGAAIDVVIGHRIAEAAVKHFLEDVTAELRNELLEAKRQVDEAPVAINSDSNG